MTTPSEITLAEYKQIKTEQSARIGTRDNLIYAMILATAGTLTISHSAHSAAYLLLVPAVGFVLGWTYVANDQMITAIGRYFRNHPALPGLGWETDCRHSVVRRNQRKAIQLAVDLTTFCAPGLVALVAFWTAPGASPLLLAASAVEAIAVGVLAWQVVAYSPLTMHGRA